MTASPLTPFRGPILLVYRGGVSAIALPGGIYGGWIQNPASLEGQGIDADAPEPLFVDPTGPAALQETATTKMLLPGDVWFAPLGQATPTYVNAESDGHRFSSIVLQPATPYPPTPSGATFPPSGPTGLINAIPSYLYEQYQDDDNLQSFVAAYNDMAQEYVDWFNQVALPVYTGLSGSLLDWVGTGLYGYPRPSLGSGLNHFVGPLNTYEFNGLAYDALDLVGPSNITATSDDVYQRILTWHLYKGDGKLFNVRWLKRRIYRFLYGVDGTDVNCAATYVISVRFGPNNAVTIVLGAGEVLINSGAWFNGFAFNEQAYDALDTDFIPSGSIPALADIFQEAVETGVLELPFQYDFTVQIGGNGGTSVIIPPN